MQNKINLNDENWTKVLNLLFHFNPLYDETLNLAYSRPQLELQTSPNNLANLFVWILVQQRKLISNRAVFMDLRLDFSFEARELN